MPEAQQYYIGIDVGGTSVKLGLFDASGELLARESVPTPSLACAEGYAAVVGGIERLMGSQRQPMLFVRGIGLAIPCPVPASGVITVAANIEIDAPALMAALQDRCSGAAIRYVNDANAAAMGELWRGSARGHRSMVMVTIGTGLGGGVVVNGDVVDGAFGAGGEIGHMCVNPAEERICGCGRRGCLEQYASATGVVSNYLRACGRAGIEPVELAGPSDSRSVFDAARSGDAAALAAIDTTVDDLSLGGGRPVPRRPARAVRGARLPRELEVRHRGRRAGERRGHLRRGLRGPARRAVRGVRRRGPEPAVHAAACVRATMGRVWDRYQPTGRNPHGKRPRLRTPESR